MEAVIKSMHPLACAELDDAFGKDWRVERRELYEDGEKMYDVLVNLDYVKIEVSDCVWLYRIDDYKFKVLTSVDYLVIIIR